MQDQNNQAWSNYRSMLIELEQESQSSYDKTLVTLSGGALGLSLVFYEKVIGEGALQWPVLLLGAWVFWTASLVCVLISFYVSGAALRKAVKQVDQQSISRTNAGGWYDKITGILNFCSGVFFIIGVISMIYFAFVNLGA